MRPIWRSAMPGGDPGQSGGRPASLLRRLSGHADQSLQRRDLGTDRRSRGRRWPNWKCRSCSVANAARCGCRPPTKPSIIAYADRPIYAACTLRIEAGGDHGYQGFAQQLPDAALQGSAPNSFKPSTSRRFRRPSNGPFFRLTTKRDPMATPSASLTTPTPSKSFPASTRCANARGCTPTPVGPTTWPRKSSTTASTKPWPATRRRCR